MRTIGTVVRGVRAPIFQAGDDLAKEVCKAVMAASKEAQAPLRDRDVIAVTESVVARVHDNCAVMRRQAEAAAGAKGDVDAFPGTKVTVGAGQDRGPGTPINVQ